MTKQVYGAKDLQELLGVSESKARRGNDKTGIWSKGPAGAPGCV